MMILAHFSSVADNPVFQMEKALSFFFSFAASRLCVKSFLDNGYIIF